MDTRSDTKSQTDPEFRLITRKLNHNTVAVKVIGFLDSLNYQLCCEELIKTTDDGFCNLIFDLSEVEHPNSFLCKPLIEIHKRTQILNGRIVILNADFRIRQLFELLGCSQQFAYCATIDSAIACISRYRS